MIKNWTLLISNIDADNLDFGQFEQDSEFLDICVSNHWFPLLLLHLWKKDNLRDIFIHLCLGSTKIFLYTCVW